MMQGMGKAMAGGGMVTPAPNGWKSYRFHIGVFPNKPLWGSSSPPAIKAPHATPSRPWSHQAMFSRQDVQGRPPTPAIKTVKPTGYHSKAGPQPVDGSKIPISGQGYRRYPCHPPWQSPPGVGLRSPERPIQGQGIGRAGRAIKPLR